MDHIANKEVLGVFEPLEAFVPDRMTSTGFRRLSDADVQAVREGVALDRLAKALGEAIAAVRPDVKVDGHVATYPYGEDPLDLRITAQRMLAAFTYQV